MCWFIDHYRFGVIFLVLLTGCVSPDDSITFETNLIGMSGVVDSVFGGGVLDSVLDVSKTIAVNELEPETKQLDQYNIKEDLSVLTDYNVATPRWASFMDVHSRDSAGLHLITYTSENKKAPVRFIKIIKKDNDIKSIEIFSARKNLISDQEIKIKWNLESQYSIQKTSQLLIRKPTVFRSVVSY